MKIEEYIAKRKKEDGLNEFDYESRMENLKICINYTLEYFNNYLSTLPADEKTVLQDMKNCKHRSKEYYEVKGEYYLGKNDSFYWDYDYKQGKNLFCIDSLYMELPKKSFIRGKKQFLEATMLYSWIYCVAGEGKDYWEKYCKLVFNN